MYKTIEELQTDVDGCIKFYNEERPHSGKYCYGKTPMKTFRESKHLAKAKELDNGSWWKVGQDSSVTSEVVGKVTIVR